jgi:hypothetical protein
MTRAHVHLDRWLADNLPAMQTLAQEERRSVRRPGRPNVQAKVDGLLADILGQPDPAPWTTVRELQYLVRRVGIRRRPNEFDVETPSEEVLRRTIRTSLMQARKGVGVTSPP